MNQDETEKAAAQLLLTAARAVRESIRDGLRPVQRERLLRDLNTALAPFEQASKLQEALSTARNGDGMGLSPLSHKPECATITDVCGNAECDCGAWNDMVSKAQAARAEPDLAKLGNKADLGAVQGDFQWYGQLCSRPGFSIREALEQGRRWVRTDLYPVAEERLSEALIAVEAIPFADRRLSTAVTAIMEAQREVGRFVDEKLRERLGMDAAPKEAEQATRKAAANDLDERAQSAESFADFKERWGPLLVQAQIADAAAVAVKVALGQADTPNTLADIKIGIDFAEVLFQRGWLVVRREFLEEFAKAAGYEHGSPISLVDHIRALKERWDQPSAPAAPTTDAALECLKGDYDALKKSWDALSSALAWALRIEHPPLAWATWREELRARAYGEKP